jgi:chemotaxis protein methyltransferase CheR
MATRVPTTVSKSDTHSDAEACAWVIRQVYDRSRIRLHDGKEPLIRARLGKRLRALGMGSLGEYTRHLEVSRDEAEFTRLLDALTTNYTHFLREEDHFRFLVETAIPTLTSGGGRTFRVWSAASATGEEPWSLAVYLSEFFPPPVWDWRIFATDISTRALETARKGIYPADKLDPMPKEWLRRNFQRGTDSWENHYRIKPALQSRVTFQHLNLLGNYGFGDRFEVIFCRNVMIYFDRETQEQLVNRFANHLVPGGYLIIGHSESLNGLKTPFQCQKPSIYRLR